MKGIIYKFLIYLEGKFGDARIFYGRKMISMGENSVIYRESEIINMKGNPQDISIGNNSHVRGELLTFNYGGKIEIGNNTFIGIGSKVWSGQSVKIGSNVLISHNVNIIDTDSHEIDYTERANGFVSLIKNGHPTQKGSILTQPIIIEDNVWISFNAIVLKGVKIGKGAVVAAGAVVTKDVPEFTLVVGNPASVVKYVK